MIGRCERMAISCARRIFLIVSGHHDPAFTVASLATTTTSLPPTWPIVVTTPAAGAVPISSPSSSPACAASQFSQRRHRAAASLRVDEALRLALADGKSCPPNSLDSTPWTEAEPSLPKPVKLQSQTSSVSIGKPITLESVLLACGENITDQSSRSSRIKTDPQSPALLPERLCH